MPSMAPSLDDATLESGGAGLAGSSSSSTSRGVKQENEKQTRALTAEALVFQWQRHAEKVNKKNGNGPLSTLDKQAIALRACKTLRDMDLQSKGHVDMEEWLHHALLTHSGMTAAQINSSLREALKRHPRLLEDLQRLFRAADVSQNGRLTLRDVIPMYSRKLWHIQPSSGLLSEKDLHSSDPEQLARDIMKDMDFDGDNAISYAEFMAFCLGRRKQEVVLHMYDVSAGLGKSFVPLLGEEMQHWWHTGVVVYNREYFWACDTVHDDPGKTAFGTPMKTVSLGYTLWRQDELHDFIISDLQPIFHRETYDIIKNNCNHFSDRLIKFLVGRRLPDEVLNQDETLQKLTTIKIVRPLLQLWSRETINARDNRSQTVTQTSKTVSAEETSLLVPGAIVKIYPGENSGGDVILGIVCNNQDQPKRVVRKPGASSSALLMCTGCNSVDTSTNEVWVRHFEIAFHRSVQDSFGQVITDLIPRSRIAVVDLKSVVDEASYHKALVMMNAASRQARPGLGASGGLIGAIPSVLPGAMDADDDILEDLLDDFPDTAPFSARDGSTLWAVMASPGRNRKELDCVKELSDEGFSVEAAAAALSSTEWQVAEARALLVSRERLRTVATSRSRSPNGPSNCPLQPRFKSKSPKQATADTSVDCEQAGKRRQDRVMVNLDDVLEGRSDELLSSLVNSGAKAGRRSSSTDEKVDRKQSGTDQKKSSGAVRRSSGADRRSSSTDGTNSQGWSESVLNI